jgi:predicted small metal-binding protein
MSRQIADCREHPSEMGCTLAIVGEPDELVTAMVDHMVAVHGHTEPREDLAAMVRGDLKDAPGALA